MITRQYGRAKMRPSLFWGIATPIVALMALACLLLPDEPAGYYASVMHPISLLIGFALAVSVAASFQRELRRAFIFLAIFLILYSLSNVHVFWEQIQPILGEMYSPVIFSIQIITYAMLLTCCGYILRVISVKELNKWGWMTSGIVLAFGVAIVTYGVLYLRENFATYDLSTISYILIRTFDAAVMVMLVPVVWLYIQYCRSRYQQSITFTVIMSGIILSLISAYVYEMAADRPLYEIAQQLQEGSVLDVIYLFSYFVIAMGLYAQRKYDEWGLRIIEKALE